MNFLCYVKFTIQISGNIYVKSIACVYWYRFAKILEFNLAYVIKRQVKFTHCFKVIALIQEVMKIWTYILFMILLVLSRKPSWVKFNDFLSIISYCFSFHIQNDFIVKSALFIEFFSISRKCANNNIHIIHSPSTKIRKNKIN